MLIALTTCFAATTAAFNATYQQQAEADARLSNGADVVLGASGAGGLPASLRDSVAKTPGVASTEPLQHRYAYVGRDLQDVYGVDANDDRAWRETPGLVVRGRHGLQSGRHARAARRTASS